MRHDTIAAIATPPGEGAIGIVRVSGPDALEVVGRIFRGKSGLGEAAGYTVHHGRLISPGGAPLDEVLVTVFREPHSYTGENSAEIGCHGGTVLTQIVLDAVLQSGARLAEPGEFSKRAFLNGKMDLSQAEAVADLIAARSRRACAVSLSQLEGKLGERIREMRDRLLNLCSLLEIDLDFAGEGLEIVSRQEIDERIREADAGLERMVESFEQGKIDREGVLIAIVGRPNAGKSSLFNALLRERRAIVTANPGTTRDAIEESLSIDGVRFRIVDTAGIRESTDVAEMEGVIRARRSMGEADIVLVVMDSMVAGGGVPVDPLIDEMDPGQKVILVMNKIDLVPVDRRGLIGPVEGSGGKAMILVSAKTSEGIEELRGLIQSSLAAAHLDGLDTPYVVNQRHREAVVKTREALQRALESLGGGLTNEFVAFDIREAVLSLREITGEMASEDVLNNIFSRFCIGK